MSSTSLPVGMRDIECPEHVKIVTTKDFVSFEKEASGRTFAGFSGSSFYGTVFVQGGRIQFSTALPLRRLVELAEYSRSQPADTVDAVRTKSNRPVELTHAKRLRRYLLEHACQGEKFILPSMTLNYGVDCLKKGGRATIVIMTANEEDTTWPAVLLLPKNACLDTTDGAHRLAELKHLIVGVEKGSGTRKRLVQITDDSQKTALLANSIDIRISFETDRVASQQDFADCAKAKALPMSLVHTFDVREDWNAIALCLVRAVPFLRANVDATASAVNLSNASRRVWSMNAVYSFVKAVLAKDPKAASKGERWDDAIAFFNAVVSKIVALQAIDAEAHGRGSGDSAGKLRKVHGGNVLLRGAGLTILAHAFNYCHSHRVKYERMAEKLNSLDWNLLDCDTGQILDDMKRDKAGYAAALSRHINEIWSPLIAVVEGVNKGAPGRFKVTSTIDTVKAAWDNVEKRLFPLEKERVAA